MKRIALNLTFLFLLCFAATALAGGFNLSALKAEAAKAVPGGQTVGESGDEHSAFVGMQGDGLNYQFTLASDTDPQMPDAEKLAYKGRTAYFFEPGMPGSGGLMILLDNDRSLTILCMAGFTAEEGIGLNDMKAIADRMDLDVL